ncbi:LacI family DNA-binding transcriptional regulator [Amycolatopsis kentuckyensis]|uniref:LacI family DNA-binding transcriptional regulator n=1 Tax=Amycolatopsis kentuckyensis TaxID=218823 RepID=UPI001ABF57C5|nr:LacI family DNA-binding transcriptional regulator [Amycolatopsis kentuckyensis]
MAQSGRRVTLREVANAAGVSTATVTRALQNSPLVEADTRERVLVAVKQLGYSPNPIARNLRTGGREGAVGLVTAGFTNVFQAGVAAGAERELRRAGLHLIIGSTDDDATREPELARAMIDRRVSALLMMPDGDDRGYLAIEHTFGTPVVLVGRPALGLAADVVMTDDDDGVRRATEQLLELGHRRIAALAGRLGSFRAGQRLDGFRAALARHGVAEDAELVAGDLTTPDQARAAVERLMDLPSPPTAVLALNLGITTGVLLDRVAHRRGSAFIGLDEHDLTAGLGISAIVRDPQEIGRQAALLALDRIARPDRPARTVTVPCDLRRRGSGEIPADS